MHDDDDVCTPDAALTSRLHLFSPLAPSAFVPSSQLDVVPPALAITVRSMSDVHQDMVAESLCSASAEADEALDPTRDTRAMLGFLTLLSENKNDREQRDGNDD